MASDNLAGRPILDAEDNVFPGRPAPEVTHLLVALGRHVLAQAANKRFVHLDRACHAVVVHRE